MAETELWLIELGRTAAGLEATEARAPRLSDDMRARLDAMKDEVARRERRLAHIALRILLEAALGPSVRHAPFVRSPAGKPSLTGCDISFSLAHAPGLALIGIGRGGALGVDIERRRPVRVPETRRTPIEREAIALAAGAPLADTDPDARFLNAWVRIEAAAKAHGSGVGPLLERLRPGRAGTVSQLPVAAGGPPIVVHDIGVAEGVFAAVALEPGRELPPLRPLPETAAAIEALLGPEQGTRR